MTAIEDEITSLPPIGSTPDGRKTTIAAHAAIEKLDDEDNAPGSKFAFSPSQLRRLIENRNPRSLIAFGGLQGLAVGLRTDVNAGLGVDEDILDEHSTSAETGANFKSASAQTKMDQKTTEAPGHTPGNFTDRRATYGENRVPRRKPKTFLQLLWMAFNDKLMFLLTASAVVSLALGITMSILVAVVVIVAATAVNDYQKNYKFQKLNQKKEERMGTVVRSGKHQSISIFDVLVGDVLHIEAGDVIPADGILIQGFDIQCDESALTGESDLLVKTPPSASIENDNDPFILGGTKATTGVGTYLVLAVGIDSSYGRIMMSLHDDVEETPLQQKLGVLAKSIIRFGLMAGGTFFAIMFIRFIVDLKHIQGGAKEKGHAFLDVLILSITIIVIAVPEGLPLTVTLALAFATTRMLKDNNLVRLLRSCEIMGNATTVCSDKTGTLTQNKMSVVAGILGPVALFRTVGFPYGHDHDTPFTKEFTASLPNTIRELIKTSFSLNSTAIETTDCNDFVGSSTETALLKFSVEHLGMGSVSEARTNGNIVQVIPFDASKKWMAVVIRLGDGRYRMLVKGAAEVILDRCVDILSDPASGSDVINMTPNSIQRLKAIILGFAQRSLRVVSVAYRDFDQWPPAASNTTISLSDLVFIGAFGIRDPLRPEVIEAVRQCQSAGVFVRMVTGDNFFTGTAIAEECGIYTAGGIAMDGPTFRKLTSRQLDLVAPRLQVLTRSSPDDKVRLVTHLKSLDEVVAVTGDGTNDALALKAADVGFSMGISGTEVAKEASAIVLMDDNFASIAKAISWGRAVNDAAKKFLQFQFTINVTAGLLTVISALVGGTDASVFSVVQLLWINLIMDTFAALALGTDFPTPDLLKRKPEPRGVAVLDVTMWKMILGQSIYQLAVIFTFHYAGESIFQYHTEQQQRQLQTMTFNIYVWMQFFNQINSRRIDNRFNILEGILQNPWFMFVQAVTLAGQVIIIFLGGEAFQVAPLTGAQWGWSLMFGVLTIPVGMLSVGATDEGPGKSGDPAEQQLDLEGIVEALRYGTAEVNAGIQLHPDTRKDDPVLVDLRQVGIPPSQNPALWQFMGSHL
ncbi:Calcium-transporting ATPase 2 [Colletotrichum sp. SAR11_240]|nr:Calcium-transporting ATPase 2 [Colletotrichum sp. SAR11_240]